MLKLKFIIILLSPLLLMATTLKTSEHLDNLERETDEYISESIKKQEVTLKKREATLKKQEATLIKQEAAQKKLVVEKAKEVETVRYSLQGCDEKASFPVTVRSNKEKGK